MVKLVKGQYNKIPVSVTSLIDYSGFSASLAINGTTKTIANLRSSSACIEFSAAEVAGIDDVTLGYLTILNKKGETHVKMLIQFKSVDSLSEALDAQRISIVIVSRFDYNWGGGGSPDMRDYVRKDAFNDITAPKNTVNSNTSAIKDILNAAKGA